MIYKAPKSECTESGRVNQDVCQHAAVNTSGVALVQFGGDQKGTFERYRIVTLDRQWE